MTHVSGGRKDKLKKFARIVDYLEAHHGDLYEVISDLSLEGNFNPPRDGSGITFLLPDKTLTAEIKKKSESDNPEDAVDIILAHILYGLFTKPKDFQRKDDIATKFGTKLIVKNVTADKVEIDNGTLVLDEKFKPLTRVGSHERGNMAVWNIKGSVTFEGVPKAVRPLRSRRGAPEPAMTEGAAENNDAAELKELRNKLLAEKVRALREDRKGSDNGRCCPLLDAVCRVLRVWSDSASRAGSATTADEFRAAKCLLTLCPLIDFYLIFNNPIIFSPETVMAAYKTGIDQDSNVTFYKSFCSDYSHPALAGDNALLLKPGSIAKVQVERDSVRENAMARLSKSTAEAMLRAYNALDQTNTLGEAYPVYPEWLAEKFRDNAGLHLLLDEFSYLAYCACRAIKAQAFPEQKAAEANSFFNAVAVAYGANGFCRPKVYTKLDKPASYGGNIDNEALYQLLMPFWRSFGIHVPCSLGDELDRCISGGHDAPTSTELIDVDTEFARDIGGYCNCSMQLSDNTLAELRHYMRVNGGKLPL